MKHAKPSSINKYFKKALSLVLCFTMLMGMVSYLAPEAGAAVTDEIGYTWGSNRYYFSDTTYPMNHIYQLNYPGYEYLYHHNTGALTKDRYITLGSSETHFNIPNSVSIIVKSYKYITVVYKSSVDQTLKVRFKQQHDHGSNRYTSYYEIPVKAGDSWQYATITFNTPFGSCSKSDCSGPPCYQVGGWRVTPEASIDIAGFMWSQVNDSTNATYINRIIANASHDETYTVTYDANGGSGAPEAQTKSYGTALTLSSTIPARTGYTFNGWNTSADGSGTNYAAGGSYTENAKATLYAQWSPITYKIDYKRNGATAGSGMTDVSDLAYDVEVTISACSFEWPGYTFVGWNTVKDGSGTAYAVGQKVKNLSSTQDTVVYLYAQWTANTYIIKFDEAGGNAIADITYTYDPGYTFTFPSCTRKGYELSHWILKEYNGEAGNWGEPGQHKFTPGNTTSEGKYGNITLQAVWTANTYTVNFDANGGDCDTASKTVTYDKTYGDMPEPTREGYAFNGWYTAAEGGKKVESSTTVTITSEHTLYARWTPLFGNLTITRPEGLDEDQDFIFTIKGIDDNNRHINLNVVSHDKTVVIDDLPVGRYTVTEWDNWSWRQTEVTVNGGEPNAPVTVEITPEGAEITYSIDDGNMIIAWLSGDSYGIRREEDEDEE